MSEEKDEKDGYVLAADYAEQKNMPVEEVIVAIGMEHIAGRVIDGKWYVNVEGEERREGHQLQ